MECEVASSIDVEPHTSIIHFSGNVTENTMSVTFPEKMCYEGVWLNINSVKLTRGGN